MKLTKIYDSRTIDDVLNKKPIVFKAEFKDKDGNKYLGWKYPKGQSHWTVMNYNFTQVSLPCGKKCNRKPSPDLTNQMLKLIEENKSSVKTFN